MVTSLADNNQTVKYTTERRVAEYKANNQRADNTEIAKALGLSTNHVKQALYRAIRKYNLLTKTLDGRYLLLSDEKRVNDEYEHLTMQIKVKDEQIARMQSGGSLLRKAGYVEQSVLTAAQIELKKANAATEHVKQQLLVANEAIERLQSQLRQYQQTLETSNAVNAEMKTQLNELTKAYNQYLHAKDNQMVTSLVTDELYIAIEYTAIEIFENAKELLYNGHSNDAVELIETCTDKTLYDEFMQLYNVYKLSSSSLNDTQKAFADAVNNQNFDKSDELAQAIFKDTKNGLKFYNQAYGRKVIIN